MLTVSELGQLEPREAKTLIDRHLAAMASQVDTLLADFNQAVNKTYKALLDELIAEQVASLEPGDNKAIVIKRLHKWADRDADFCLDRVLFETLDAFNTGDIPVELVRMDCQHDRGMDPEVDDDVLVQVNLLYPVVNHHPAVALGAVTVLPELWTILPESLEGKGLSTVYDGVGPITVFDPVTCPVPLGEDGLDLDAIADLVLAAGR